MTVKLHYRNVYEDLRGIYRGDYCRSIKAAHEARSPSAIYLGVEAVAPHWNEDVVVFFYPARTETSA